MIERSKVRQAAKKKADDEKQALQTLKKDQAEKAAQLLAAASKNSIPEPPKFFAEASLGDGVTAVPEVLFESIAADSFDTPFILRKPQFVEETVCQKDIAMAMT
eukprot:3804300-Karenia_brevis.AAC.1